MTFANSRAVNSPRQREGHREIAEMRPRATFIGAGTYKGLTVKGKISEGKNMWIGPVSMTMGGKSYDYYKSSYWWSF